MQTVLKAINPVYSLKTDAEAEVPIFCLPDVKSLLFGRHPEAGKS